MDDSFGEDSEDEFEKSNSFSKDQLTVPENEEQIDPPKFTEEVDSEGQINPADQSKSSKRNWSSDSVSYLTSTFGLLKKLVKNQRKKQKIEKFILCESSTKEDLLLYLNYNKYKYYWANFLIGLLYAVTRISYIPIMISLMVNLNLISLMCLILIMIYSLKLKRLFFDGLKLMSWCMTVIMLMHSLHKYLQYVLVDKFQIDKKYYGETNFYIRFMEIF